MNNNVAFIPLGGGQRVGASCYYMRIGESNIILDAGARQRLFTIARKVGIEWSETDLKQLAAVCMGQISADINGFSMGGGPKTSTNIEAIYTLSICANTVQLSKLAALHDTTRYLQACLYVHGKTRTDLQWIQDEFEEDAKKSIKGLSNNIQFSSYAIGIALRKDGVSNSILSAEMEGKIVKRLCNVIATGRLSEEELVCCMLSLGWICDQRNNSSDIDGSIIKEASDTIRDIDDYYPVLTDMELEKPRSVASKMINGALLDVEEEQFLLTKLER